jgi:hypothetical protein
MIVFVQIYNDRPELEEPLAYHRREWEGDHPVADADETGPIRDLDDLAAALDGAQISEHSDYTIDMLPTFGGEPLSDPNVVSWDDGRVLVHDGAGRFTIHLRE